MVLAALVAMVVSALAIPALAQGRFSPENFSNGPQNGILFGGDRGGDQGDRGRSFQDFANSFAPQGLFSQDGGEDRGDRANRADTFDNGDNGNQRDNGNWWDNNWWNDNHNDTPAVSQNFDQEAQSGNVSQSFNVSNTGDNSNQCVGITGNANTGNAQNQIGVIQYASDADDFEFDDTGANLTVTGSGTTTCGQQVNQAAAAG